MSMGFSLRYYVFQKVSTALDQTVPSLHGGRGLVAKRHFKCGDTEMQWPFDVTNCPARCEMLRRNS